MSLVKEGGDSSLIFVILGHQSAQFDGSVDVRMYKHARRREMRVVDGRPPHISDHVIF